MANLAGGADLSGASLKYANLLGAKLSNADLHGGNLSRATWTDGRICADSSIGECKLVADDCPSRRRVVASCLGGKEN